MLEPRLVLSAYYNFNSVAQTGVGPHNFTHLGQGPSLNSAGNVAFQAEAMNSSSQPADNIYAFELSTSNTKQLMADVFEYTNVGASSSVAGTASISGQVQINNSNAVLARRRLNALIAIGGPLGPQNVAPLTYLETWDAVSTSTMGLPIAQVANGVPAALSGPWFFINPVTGGVWPSAINYGTAFEGLIGGWSFNDDNRAAYGALLGNGQGSGNSLVSSPQGTGFPFLGIGTPSFQSQPMVSNPRIPGNVNSSTIVVRNGDATTGNIIYKLDFNLGGIQQVANASMGFTALGKPSVSDDGEVIAFAGVDAAGPGIFVSINTSTGFSSPQRIVGNEGFLGYDDAGNPISFSSIDLDNRVGVVRRQAGAGGLRGDSITVSFMGTPSSSSRDNPAIGGSQPLLFSAQKGIWTVTVDLESELDPPAGMNPLRFNPTSPIPVVQFGDQINGQVITNLAIHDSLSDGFSELVDGTLQVRPAVAGRADHRIAFWAQTASGAEMIVTGDHFDNDNDGLLNHWERKGIDIDQDGAIDLDLPAMGANVNHKDLFLEIDWTNGRTAGVLRPWSNEPYAGVTRRLVEMFANSPVTNPDSINGITLHVDAGPGFDNYGNRLSQNLPLIGLQGGDLIGTTTDASAPVDVVYFGKEGTLSVPGLATRSLHEIKNMFFGGADKWARELAFKYTVMADFMDVFRESSTVFTSFVSTAGTATVTLVDPLPASLKKLNFVKIISGKGAGQVRQINNITGSTLQLIGNWSEVPDSTSRIVILDGHSGRAEVYFRPETDNNAIPGNDFLVTIFGAISPTAAAIQGMPAKTFYQWRTLAHELGHTLGLRHGGNDHDAEKSAAVYQSLMSYTHQTEKTSIVRSYSNASDATFNDWGYVKLDFQRSLMMLGNSYSDDIPNYEVHHDEQLPSLPESNVGPVVADIVINNGDDQRSQVTRIDVTFSESVNFVSLISSGQVFDAVTLQALSAHPGAINLMGPARFAWHAGENRLQIDLTTDGSGSSTVPMLVDDNFELRFQASLITSTSSGATLEDTDDTSDGSYRFTFFQLAGDYNLDRTVNNFDYASWRSGYGSSDGPAADGNANGVVDTADFVLWRRNVGATLPLPAAAFMSSPSDDLPSMKATRIQFANSSAEPTPDQSTRRRKMLPSTREAWFSLVGQRELPSRHKVHAIERAALGLARFDHNLLISLAREMRAQRDETANDVAFADSLHRPGDVSTTLTAGNICTGSMLGKRRKVNA